MEKCQLTFHQSRFWRNSGRKGTTLRYGGVFKSLKYIQKVTSLNSVGILIHITHFFLPRCGLDKGMKYTPFSSLSGYRLSVLHPKHIVYLCLIFLHKQHNSTIQLLYYASSLLSSMELSEPMSEYS
jgi:hypothetical protein